ncbi:O-antigen ligase family protein [Salmonirosea aquatica]|uniref:O-antigen ligase domain-containing protein n=1 Tax=Salmonirosea aquatica TaxID=2654236 RepID=A0A7C9F707_9BACT|nr:O-antigen ligase domain-containing protein [Cytophagaceae bacterium SJW1-29]
MNLKAYLVRTLWDEKLRNPLGLGLLAVLAGGVALLVGFYGVLPGLLLMAAMVALPTVYAIVAYPKFGIVVLLITAYFLFFFLRLGLNFPIGTLMDAMEWLLILGMILTFRNTTDRTVFKSPVAMMIMVWVGYTVLQVANPWAESRMAWLYTVRTVGAVTLMYYVFVYRIDSIAYLRLLVRLWVVLAFLGALYGFKQEYLGFAAAEFQEMSSDPLMVSLLYIDGHWRKYSVFSDPVTFSYNMVLAFFICLSLIRAKASLAANGLLIAVGGLCIMAMLFSATRGAYVLIPAGLTLFFILQFSKKILWLALASVFVLGVLITIPTSNPTLYRFQSAFKPSDDASFNLRAQNQKRIQPYILSHPMGGGLGATGAWGVRFAPNSYLASFPPDSGYMRIAAEMGWIGLLLFGILLFLILKTGIDTFYLLRNRELKSYCLAMTVAVFVLGIGSYPQEAIVQFPSNILFYLAAAIIQCTQKLDYPTPDLLSNDS